MQRVRLGCERCADKSCAMKLAMSFSIRAFGDLAYAMLSSSTTVHHLVRISADVRDDVDRFSDSSHSVCSGADELVALLAIDLATLSPVGGVLRDPVHFRTPATETLTQPTVRESSNDPSISGSCKLRRWLANGWISAQKCSLLFKFPSKFPILTVFGLLTRIDRQQLGIYTRTVGVLGGYSAKSGRHVTGSAFP